MHRTPPERRVFLAWAESFILKHSCLSCTLVVGKQRKLQISAFLLPPPSPPTNPPCPFFILINFLQFQIFKLPKKHIFSFLCRTPNLASTFSLTIFSFCSEKFANSKLQIFKLLCNPRLESSAIAQTYSSTLRWRRGKYPEKGLKRRTSCHFDRGCSTPWTPLIPLLLANCPWIAGPGRLFRTPGAPKASQCSGGTLKSVLPPLLQSNLVANWKCPQ